MKRLTSLTLTILLCTTAYLLRQQFLLKQHVKYLHDLQSSVITQNRDVEVATSPSIDDDMAVAEYISAVADTGSVNFKTDQKKRRLYKDLAYGLDEYAKRNNSLYPVDIAEIEPYVIKNEDISFDESISLVEYTVLPDTLGNTNGCYRLTTRFASPSYALHHDDDGVFVMIPPTSVCNQYQPKESR